MTYDEGKTNIAFFLLLTTAHLFAVYVGDCPWLIQRFSLGAIWRAREREPITGAWGGAPSGVQGQSQGVRGQSPLKLES